MDFSISTKELKDIVADVDARKLDEGTIYESSTKKMIAFIESTEAESLTFDQLYEFYIPGLELTEENIVSFGCDRGSCFIGCGSDRGCCSNYEGCCYLSAFACYLHDLACKDCFDKNFCGPKCKPDTPQTKTVKVFTLII